jgi:hypothetical protein
MKITLLFTLFGLIFSLNITAQSFSYGFEKKGRSQVILIDTAVIIITKSLTPILKDSTELRLSLINCHRYTIYVIYGLSKDSLKLRETMEALKIEKLVSVIGNNVTGKTIIKQGVRDTIYDPVFHSYFDMTYYQINYRDKPDIVFRQNMQFACTSYYRNLTFEKELRKGFFLRYGRVEGDKSELNSKDDLLVDVTTNYWTLYRKTK